MPGHVLPICTEKSMWAVVSVFAALKAGATMVLLEPSLPEQRLQAIVGHVGAQLILCSEGCQGLASRLCPNILPIGSSTDISSTDISSTDISSIESCPQGLNDPQGLDPSAPAYIVFTSGTTGVPKGVVVTHKSAATAIHHQRDILGYGPSSRCLDVASYGFDLSIMNMYATLMSGGCLCIPSEDDRRSNLAASIDHLGANHIFTTPSLLRFLGPEEVPGLRTVISGGEPLTVDDLEPWWGGEVRLVNAYGPSECTSVSGINWDPETPGHLLTLGVGVGAHFWIVDPSNPDVLVPPGCVGELLIEGPLVGQGYLGDPERTAASFLNDTKWLLHGSPTASVPGRSSRLYRTGDLVRYVTADWAGQDGRFRVEFVGRRDTQVKIRGQRVALGEVERCVQECVPGIRQVAAELITPGGRSMLAAFVSLTKSTDTNAVDSKADGSKADGSKADGSKADIYQLSPEVEEKLRAHLPSYMMPSVFFSVAELPLNVSGKTDRKMLRALGSAFTAQQLADSLSGGRDQGRAQGRAQPTTETGRLIQSLWAQALSLPSSMIGLDDSFFRLGGDSIVAMNMVAAVRKAGFHMTVANVFLRPRLRDAIELVTEKGRSSMSRSQLERIKHDGLVAQSFAQERLFFLERLHPGLSWYLVRFAVRLRGPLDMTALRRAFAALEARHESLRTIFLSVEGESLQLVKPYKDSRLDMVNAEDGQESLSAALRRHQSVRFDLESEPGWSVQVLRAGDEDHVLSLTIHHIISDGWSLDVLRHELATLYRAARQGHDLSSALPSLPIHYRDYSLWQRSSERETTYQQQLDYWLAELASSRPAEMPADKARPDALSGEAGVVPFIISGELYEKLTSFCEEHGVTAFIVLFAAFRATQYRMTGVADANIGVPNANRERWEVRSLIGFFVNLQVIRTFVDEDDTFLSLVSQTQKKTAASFENQDVPFERIVGGLRRERDLSRNALAQLVFALHGQKKLGHLHLDDVESEVVALPPATRFDLEFHLFQEDGFLRSEVLYSTDLYERSTMTNMVSLFLSVLKQGLETPDRPIASLPFQRSSQALVWQDDIVQTPYPRDSNICDVFRHQVALGPQKVAARDAHRSLTYEELDRESTTVARWLSRRNLPAETLVGVLAPRSCETLVAMMGILKANCAYLPLDINIPPGRMSQILSTNNNQTGSNQTGNNQTGDALVLVSSTMQLPVLDLPNIEFRRISETLVGEDTLQGHGQADRSPTATSLAYVMYTSGSTGTPKGVMIEHRAVLRVATGNSLVDAVEGRGSRVMAHISSIAFDAATWEVYVALLNGGTVLCVDRDTMLDSESLSALFAENKVSSMFITPALLKQYLTGCPEAIGSLDTLLIGGDLVDPQDVRASQRLMGPRKKVINAYGPTENTVFSAWSVLDDDDAFAQGVPIGRSISNSGVLVVDAERQPVPAGVLGELVVTGDGLARGYTDAARDADRFIWLPSDDPTVQVRAYRTGDYVRRSSDGRLRYVGRRDGQIKIRGQRLELGEIEHLLRSHEDVHDTAVVVQQDQLVAFYTSQSVEREETSSEVTLTLEKEAKERVQDWRGIFDGDKYTSITRVDADQIGRDFVGWTSMMDGNNIPRDEMNEWLDDTIALILRDGPPGTVLEVGTGSGMIVFNLAEHVDGYIGLDPSELAVSFVRAAAEQYPAFRGKPVVMHEAAGDRLKTLEPAPEADVAIINSVAQYFPSQQYLYTLVEDLLTVRGIKRIYFGDMRSYALYDQFLARRVLFAVDSQEMTPEDVRINMADIRALEPEFLADPGFFTGLTARLPHLVAHVEIVPKSMVANNELSSFRYTAVIHGHQLSGDLDASREIVDVDSWHDFEAERLTRESVLSLLHDSESVVAVSNITYRHTIVERRVLEALEHQSEALEQPDWLSTCRQEAKRIASLNAIDLEDMAASAGFKVQVSWARQFSMAGSLDAVFYREPPTSTSTPTSRPLFRFPTDHIGRPQEHMTNSPLEKSKLTNNLFAQRRTEKVIVGDLQTLAKGQLPSYMVPQRFVLLDTMPVNVNGKVNRVELETLAAQLTTIKEDATATRQPVTQDQRDVQKAWCRVLGLDKSAVGLDHDFFELGGNSISAMKVVSEASKLHLRLTVPDLFRHPTLGGLAAQAVRMTQKADLVIAPFSLLGDVDLDEMRRDIEQEYSLSTLQDVYPCTPLQEAVFALTSKHEGHYTLRQVMEISRDIDLGRFRDAWHEVIHRTPVLRTRIVQHTRLGLLQVVHGGQPAWTEGTNIDEYLDEYLEADAGETMSLGQPLARFALISDLDPNKPAHLVLTLHHALYDGWSLSLVLDAVDRAYRGQAWDEGPPFQSLIRHIQEQGTAGMSLYWQESLDDFESAVYPTIPPSVASPVAETVITHEFAPTAHHNSLRVTTTTLARGAWALVAGHMSGTDDVVFGVTVAGRGAPIHGIDRMMGPTIATVPFRVRIDGDEDVASYLGRLQQQAVDMMPHEQLGLGRMARLGQGARQACQFQTLLVVQQDEFDWEETSMGRWIDSGSQLYRMGDLGLVIQIHDKGDRLACSALFDPRVVKPWLAERLLCRLECVMEQLERFVGMQERLCSVQVASPRDVQDIWSWNGEVPASVDRCIHEIVVQQAQTTPEAVAVCAWDGEMTYRELVSSAEQVASHLVSRDVYRAGSIVPLCFEKSLWAVVSMVAVHMAGSGVVFLDPALPEQRLLSIVEQVDPDIILSSESNADFSLRLLPHRMIVGASLTSTNPEPLAGTQHVVQEASDSHSTAYIAFTSGTTGAPKGSVISHRSFCSAMHHQIPALGVTPESRVFDFSSHSFDGVFLNTFVALTAGACVCVPNDDERKNDLEGSIRRLRATSAFITPSLSRLLTPENLPDLEALWVGGEMVRSEDFEHWWRCKRLINIYGPSECTPLSIINPLPTTLDDFTKLGRGQGVNTWIVDPRNPEVLMAPGAAGELLLEGPLVSSAGYLNKPEQTAAAYLDDPTWLREAIPGHEGRRGRLYKTGDVVRCNESGVLEYIGRKDVQVKIRGQRIELEEVEFQILASCPGEFSRVVVEVINLEHDGSTGRRSTLAAFLQAAEHDSQTECRVEPLFPDDMEDRLAQRLPSYMIPTRYFSITQIPMTSTGKTNRKMIREMGQSWSPQQLAAAYESARLGLDKRRERRLTPAEQTMQRLWAAVLPVNGASDIGRNDSFLGLGGDSIAAMKLVGEAQKAGLPISVADVFRHPRLYQLAAAAAAGVDAHVQTLIPTSNPIVQQSSAQERLWFLEKLHPGADWYLVPFAIRLQGSLDMGALNSAVNALVERHEALRTVFDSTEDGINIQKILPHQDREICVITRPDDEHEANVDELIMKERTTPFDLSSETGIRVHVYCVGTNHHILSIVMHHIVSDGWSVDVFRRELGALYAAALGGMDLSAVLEPLPIQYKDYSVWQRHLTASESSLEYWNRTLETSRAAEFLCDKPRPAVLSGRAGIHTIRLGASVVERLSLLSRQLDATPFAILLSAFRATHYRLTGSLDATMGTVNANRDRWEVKDLIGFFVNLQCVRMALDEATSFGELVRDTQSTLGDVFTHQSVPFEQIVSSQKQTRDLSRNPLVQVVVTLNAHKNLDRFEMEGLRSEMVDYPVTSRFDLELLFSHEGTADGDALRGDLIYSTDLFQPETIESLATTFEMLLGHVLVDPTVPIATTPLLTDKDVSLLRELDVLGQHETNYPRDMSVPEVFRQQARLYPDRIAVRDGQSQLTYAELDDMSDTLAAWLSQQLQPHRPEALVGVICERCCLTIVALLATLKANFAYLPLDSRSPVAHTNAILSLVRDDLALVLTDQSEPPSENVRCVNITDALGQTQQSSVQVDSPGPTSLACVMFTGERGVKIEHRAIVRLALEPLQAAVLSRQETSGRMFAHVASIASDASTYEIYTALLQGHALMCIDTMDALEPAVASTVFSTQGIDVACLSPALLKQYLAYCPSVIAGLELLTCGPDRMDVRDVVAAQSLVRGSVISGYGQTENGVFSTLYRLPGDVHEFSNGVPMGRSISNSGAYVVDAHLRLVPLGVVGELVVTGDGLARGYTDSSHNKSRFVDVDIDGRACRAYRTGDRARMRLSDGLLEFIGRIDTEVKIKNQRVDLGEVDEALRSHASVTDAACISVRDETDRETYIAAYVVVGQGDDGQDEDSRLSAELLQMLESRLPSYMIPQSIGFLESLPVTVNGTINRKALADMPRQAATGSSARRQPATELGRKMQEIWAGLLVLQSSTIGLDDSFFRLGGDSLAAMRMVGEARKAGIQLEVADVFRHPLLGHLISHTSSSGPASLMIPPSEHDGPVEQSFSQERLWFLEQLYPGQTWYLVPWTLRLRGTLDMAALTRALAAVEKRHETLRTTFCIADGVSLQVVQPFEAKEIQVVNVDEARLMQLLTLDHATPFDLETEPGWRVTIYRLSETDHALSIVMHHIVSDGWSLNILRRELADYYADGLRGEDPMDRPAMPIQFRDYSVWQRRTHARQHLQAQLDHWVRKLEDSRPAQLPLDKARPETLSGEAEVQTFCLEGPAHGLLQGFCDKHGITPNIVLLAAFRTAHYRLTGDRDATLGSPNANRDRWEIRDVIGFFVNMHCIRMVVEDDDTFLQLVQQLHADSIDSFAHQDVPFEQLVSLVQKDRDMSRHPLVQIIFLYHAQKSFDPVSLQGLDTELLTTGITSRFDIEFNCYQHDQSIGGHVVYSTELFVKETIDSLIHVFQDVLVAGLAEPGEEIRQLALTLPSNQQIEETEAVSTNLEHRARMYVVDPRRRPVPKGVVGEIFVTDTERDLNPVTVMDGEPVKAYSTGHHGRRRPRDGQIEDLGRIDDQVEIRGQRFRLRHVNHVLLSDSAVLEASAVAYEEDGECVLAAFVSSQSEGDDKKGNERIHQRLRDALECLPSYMVPKTIFRLDALPKNANGEIDAQALVSHAQTHSHIIQQPLQMIRRDPFTAVQQSMRTIWAQVLGLDPSEIGLDDSFFRLGGDSLAAMKVVGEARKHHIEIQVADIFRSPRLEELTSKASITQGVKASSGIPRLVRDESENDVQTERQSFAQERLWFLHQLHAGLSWYVIAFAVRLRGPLRLDALQSALWALEKRHETLRTTFSSVQGVGYQQIHPFRPNNMDVVKTTAADSRDCLSEALRRDQTRPFDLETSSGWRVKLYKLTDVDSDVDQHILSIAIHHIIADGWSVDTLRRELAAYYSASVRGEVMPGEAVELPIQYRDFSVWQRQQLENTSSDTDAFQNQLNYWVRHLQGSRPAEFPCDKPRPAALSGNASAEPIRIEGQLYRDLQRFCEASNVTPYAALLAAFRVTHFRLSGAEDATIGTPNANRDRWELRDLIGFFVNMQCLRIPTDGQDSFEDVVRRVHAVSTDAFAHQDVPFERIVAKLQRDRDVSRNPLAQIMFALHAQKELGHLSFEGIESELVETDGLTSRFDMEVHFFQEDDALQGHCLFSTDLYRPETIRSMLSVFFQVIEQGLGGSREPIESMDLLTPAHLEALGDLGVTETRTSNYPREASLVDVFRRQVIQTPATVAVKDSSTQMTYSELDQASDGIARWLVTALGCPPETLIGVFTDRSCETIALLLGILKAGLAYLPLDTRSPAARIRTILCSVEGRKIVLLGPGVEFPVEAAVDVTDLEIFNTSDMTLEQTVSVTLPSAEATSPAYVMFTSGSTGTPKGVKVSHRAVMRLARDNTDLFEHVPPNPVVTHTSNLAFDSSTWEIYSAILNGGTLVCISLDVLLDTATLHRTLLEERVDVFWATPALIREYLAQRPQIFDAVRTLFAGGERFDPRDAHEVARILSSHGGRFIHVYGPTENTVFSTSYWVRGEEHDACANGVPIGRAITNSGAYVMDSKQRLVPPGVIGELVVVGDGLADGYTDKSRDADRFISLSVGDGQQVRAYRTGDYVRLRPVDGMLEFHGRIDGQVKIRGQRVELGEIDETLCRHPLVDGAVTVLHKTDDEALLVSFVAVGHVAEAATEMRSQLLEKAQSTLPSYMVPRSIVFVDRLPVNANGKFDRRALEKEAATQLATTSPDIQRGVIQPPVTDFQVKLQAIWSRVLNVKSDEIGLGDSFFQLGGDSLAAMRVVGEARNVGLSLTVADMFREPRLQQLAAVVQDMSSTDTVQQTITRATDATPVNEQSFAQERLWFMEQLHPGLTWYHMPLALTLRGTLNLEALSTALVRLEHRHEILRTTFSSSVEGRSLQEVHAPNVNRALRIITVEDEAAMQEALQAEQTTPFRLETEPGWRVALIRRDPEHHVLSVVMHHIISDGWSLGVIRRELVTSYNATLQGLDDPTGPLAVQYRDFSLWQRQHSESAEYDRQLAYWVDELESSRPAELYADKPRPAALSGHAGVESFIIDGALHERLRQYTREHDTTLFSTLLAAFRATHFRLTGSVDGVIGTPNANRDRWEVKDMVGFFVNMQCMRLRLDDESSFDDLVEHVKAVSLASLANQDISFERIVASLARARNLSRNPLAQLSFAFHADMGVDGFAFDGLSTEPMETPVTTRFDAEFHVFQVDHELRGHLIYSTDLFASDSVKQVISTFQTILESCLGSSSTPISHLSLMDERQMALLDTMGLLERRNVPYDNDKSITDIFREQASLHPDRIAVREHDSSKNLTYRQLDEQSDIMAQWLATSQDGEPFAPETPVGLFADRSGQAIIAVLGILKAGLCYVPFDLRVPADRMRTVLSSCAVQGRRSLVLVGSDVTPPVLDDASDVHFLSIDEALTTASTRDLDDNFVPRSPLPSSLAYILFTSGSTGTPKGVQVEHRSIVHVVLDSLVTQSMPSPMIVTHLGNPSFDLSPWEMYTALLSGGTVVCIDAEALVDVEMRHDLFVQNRVNVSMLTPAMIKQFLKEDQAIFRNLECLSSVGDRADVDDLAVVRQLMRGSKTIWNGYGPTENTILSTVYRIPVEEEHANGVPVGRAFKNLRAYVMDKRQQLMPLGAVGEVVVAGDGLARGYLDPAQDEDRFISIQLGGQERRAYRTGDLMRYRPVDGQLEFLGRVDNQVKIRGQRLELDEVEHCLGQHPSVTQSVALLLRDGDQPRLIAFVEVPDLDLNRDEVPITRQIMDLARSQLPPYMIPQSLTILPKVPLNANGKLDRKALAAMEPRSHTAGERFVRQPTSDHDKQMRAIWAKVLNIQDQSSIGLDDSFFMLGGNSMTAMKLVGEARKVGVQLTVTDIFRHDTLEGLSANAIYRHHDADAEEATAEMEMLSLVDPASKDALLADLDLQGHSITRDMVEDILPTTSAQGEYLSGPVARQEFTNYFYIDLGSSVDIPRLSEACTMVTDRLPILRTLFLPLRDQLWQVVLRQSDADTGLQVVQDARGQPTLGELFDDVCSADWQAGTGSNHQPHTAFKLIRHKVEGYRLVIRLSHAQYDGVSMPVIVQTIMTAYNGGVLSQPGPNFSRFLAHAAARREGSKAHWRRLLQGSSSSTSIRARLPAIVDTSCEPSTTGAQYEVRLPGLPNRITSATVASASWAILLSLLMGDSDIIYGNRVAGRNSIIDGIETIAGPLLNIVPTRVRLSWSQTPAELFASVQDQFLSMGEADGLGFEDILKHATDWSLTDEQQHPREAFGFGTVIQHQNIDETPEVVSGETQTRVGFYNNPAVVQRYCVMLSYPQSDGLLVKVGANSHIMSDATAEMLVSKLADIMTRLTRSLDVPMARCMAGLDLQF